MNAIYTSITAQMQCTVEGGVLFIRDWPKVGPWERLDVTVEEARVRRDSAESQESRYRWGCIADCLTGNKNSCRYDDPESVRLERQIARLTEELQAARERELADRPVVSTTSE